MDANWESALNDLSPRTNIFKVLVYLSFRGQCNPTEITRDTGIPAGTVRPALRTLLEKRYINQSEAGAYHSNIPFTEIISHLYSLAQK